jgi:hypothetical protein
MHQHALPLQRHGRLHRLQQQQQQQVETARAAATNNGPESSLKMQADGGLTVKCLLSS